MLEHENRVLFSIFQLLEEEEWLFIVAQTPLYTITCSGVSDTEQIFYPFQTLTGGAIANEHGIILPSIVVNAVFFESSRKNLPSGVLQANFEAFKVIRAFLPPRFRRRFQRVSGLLCRRVVSRRTRHAAIMSGNVVLCSLRRSIWRLSDVCFGWGLLRFDELIPFERWLPA